MPTPESVAAILSATEKDAGLRLEILSWLRRTAVPRGQELHSFIGMLIAIVAVAVTVAAMDPWVALGVGVLSFAGLFWLAVASTDFLIDLGERNRHAAAWQAALEDAIAAEAAARRPWWKRR